jgi:chromosome segregation ATPase
MELTFFQTLIFIYAIPVFCLVCVIYLIFIVSTRQHDLTLIQKSYENNLQRLISSITQSSDKMEIEHRNALEDISSNSKKTIMNEKEEIERELVKINQNLKEVLTTQMHYVKAKENEITECRATNARLRKQISNLKKRCTPNDNA